ncbi:hypothetical protein ACFQ60_18965 [Streptomyces zhihengii]
MGGALRAPPRRPGHPERLAARADRTALRIAAGGTKSFSVAAPVSHLANSADEQKAREVLIQAQDRSLIRSAGRLAEERNDINGPTMADLNLEITAARSRTPGSPSSSSATTVSRTCSPCRSSGARTRCGRWPPSWRASRSTAS